MTLKVKMLPAFDLIKGGTNGIARVAENYYKNVPRFDIEYTDGDDFDVLATHAGMSQKFSGGPMVAHCHGLYWTADYPFSKVFKEINRDVIENLRHSTAISVPSDWVAETIRRDMRVNPWVINHGVDWDDWQCTCPTEGYVLWAKNRNLDVCDPSPVGYLADYRKNLQFVSTFAPDEKNRDNLTVIGVKTHKDIKSVIQRAAIYLSTTKETFGIATLEAMASGVPILGYAWGGNLDIVRHKSNGYLAIPGDKADLAAGLEYCMRQRSRLAKNAREDAKEWGWDKVARKVANLYKYAYQKYMNQKEPTVSIIIPSYNYGNIVGRAIESSINQSYPYVTNIIVVDDGSPDDGLTRQVVREYSQKDKRVEYIRQDNKGVAHARNLGIENAPTKYICCLDADDVIAPQFVEACVPDLEADNTLGIAYTKLRYIDETKGENFVPSWPAEFDYDRQVTGGNQVPTCCVFRREAWERTGGYHQRYAPEGAGTEDAEFWLRIGAIGYGGKLASHLPLFEYHGGHGATSVKGYQPRDWLGYHPWTKDKKFPFISVATPEERSHPVRQYDMPRVSVVIPVGPGHDKLVYHALDSLEAQSFRNWEAILVNDTDVELELTAYPYVRVFKTKGKQGAGTARNLGASKARGEYLFWLDADDSLTPECLEHALYVIDSEGKQIVYTDYAAIAYVSPEDVKRAGRELLDYNQKTGESVFKGNALNFDPIRAAKQPYDDYLWCMVSALVPKDWHNEIGGFDENMKSWEDWDYWIRMAKAGKSFIRLAEPLMVYFYYTGMRRGVGQENRQELIKYMLDKYKEIPSMPCQTCGNRSVVIPTYKNPVSERMDQLNMQSDSDYILCELTDPNTGRHLIYGGSTGQAYGSRKTGEKFLVHKRDIATRPDIFKPVPVEKPVSIKPVEQPVVVKDVVESVKVVVEDDKPVTIKRGRKPKVQ